MKTLPFTRHLVTLAVALLMTPCTFGQTKASDPCSSNPQSKVTFKNEFPIAVNSKPYIINQDQIDEKNRLFKDCIHYAKTPNLDPLKIDAIDVVKTLYCDAELIRQNLKIPNKTYITGVWMIIGMVNEDITYSFQPTVLTVGPKDKDLYPFKTAKRGTIYCYKNNEFEPESKDQLAEKQKLYFNTVRIKHFDKSWAKHKAGKFIRRNKLRDDWRGDAREVFYSFQEILEFYSDHNRLEDCTNEFYKSAILVNHSAANFSTKRKWLHSWRVKHNTYITVSTSDSLNKSDIGISSASNLKKVDPGTNLAHVCPSRCNDLQYSGAQ